MRFSSVAIAVAAICGLAGSAEAARVLYAYSNTAGDSIVAITNGYVQPDPTADQDHPQLVVAPTISCVARGRFCDGAYVGSVTIDAGRSGILLYSVIRNLAQDVVYGTEWLSNRPLDLTVGRDHFVIRELADSEAIYAYSNTAGQSIVAVTNGYVQPGPAAKSNDSTYVVVPTVICEGLGKFCQTAYIGNLTVDYGQIYGGLRRFSYIFSGQLNISYATEWLTNQPLDQTVGSERFVIMGPAISAPEPASWAMMLVGFALSGSAMRRRRKAALSTELSA